MIDLLVGVEVLVGEVRGDAAAGVEVLALEISAVLTGLAVAAVGPEVPLVVVVVVVLEHFLGCSYIASVVGGNGWT